MNITIGSKVMTSLQNTMGDTLTEFIKSSIRDNLCASIRLNMEIDILSYENAEKWFNHYAPHIFKKPAYCTSQANVVDHNAGKIADISTGTYMFKFRNGTLCIVKISMITEKHRCTNQWPTRELHAMQVYFIGRGRKILFKRFVHYISSWARTSKDSLQIINYDSERGGRNTQIPKKTMDDVIFTQKEELCTLVDNWLQNADIFKSRGIIHKLGILLYGEPGTGKTSIARALADQYNARIHNISIENIDSISHVICKEAAYLDDSTITRDIILIEDIDFLINHNNREMTSRATEKMDAKMRAFLQILDGVVSFDECIIIATTNYIDRLDKAMIRDGRFDIKMEIKPLDRNDALKMCKLFLLTDEESEVLLNTIEFPIIPATLQNQIITSINKFKGGIEL